MTQTTFDEENLARVVRRAVKEEIETINKQSGMQPRERVILYSINALAKFLNCSPPTAQKLKNEGRIPYSQVGRKIQFDSVEVLKAMEPKKKP